MEFIPTKPGKYYCQPFWNGKNQPRQLIECYMKTIERIPGDPFYDDDEFPGEELVCDYSGYTHFVCLTGINKWEVKMSPKEFKEKMKEISEQSRNPEFKHMDADELLCDILEELGYGEGIKIFIGMIK